MLDSKIIPKYHKTNLGQKEYLEYYKPQIHQVGAEVPGSNL
jgi:hypothetical protein